jgi:uncharacterized protein (TIGR03790 family)
MVARRLFLAVLAVVSSANTLWAGGSGLNVLVVVNQNSANSIQLANAYCRQRSVPPQNVLRLTNQWSGGSNYCAVDEFQNELCSPLLAMLPARHLTNQIQFVLLSMDLPYTVLGANGVNGATSALFYGFKPDTTPPSGLPASCSLPIDSDNSYAFSELPFAGAAPQTASTNSFLAVMLTDSNGLANAELILDRAVAADSTFPTQPVYLAKTDDSARNVRFYEFDNAIFDTRVHGGYSMVRLHTDSTDYTNLLGLETGLTDFSLPTNAYVPGAIADNLTSFGGDLLINSGQTPLLAFLDAGAAISYGTVVEPCNYLQKFPNPLDCFYQARGFCLAEAYYQSLQNPYQGIMVGEPLSAPFALRGQALWDQLPSGTAALSGRTNLQLSFTAAAASLPLNQVDLFVDGSWFATLTNLPPAPGDVLSVTLNGLTNGYVVPAQATIAGVASGLAEVLNEAANNTLVSATAFGDRIELHSLNSALPGDALSLSAGVTNGNTAPAAFLTPALPVFLDSIATGYHNLLVSNAPAVGDWLQLSITETNGANFTLSVTNTTNGATIGQFLQVLINAVNTPALWTSSGVLADDFDDESSYGYADFNLYARSPGWAAAAIQVTLTASPDLLVQTPATNLLQDNLSDLEPRNHLYVASGSLSLPVIWTLDTTLLPDGYHQLTAVAYEGTSVRTQTQVSRNVLILNTGLSASLNTLFGGSNTDVGATLQFSVTVNTNNVGAIELFSTGGSLGAVSNQAPAYFSVPGANLGVGLHPFYAVVTGATGNQYRTASTWINLIGPEPPFAISVSDPPLTLSWPCTVGRSYEVLMAANLTGPFQVAASFISSNSPAVWVDTNAAVTQRFYCVQSSY